jgi:DNA-binding transcriptional regulator YiaG
MRIEELIAGLGLTDAEIAVKLCVAPMSVYRWRKGRKVPTPMARKALCKLASIPVAQVDWSKPNDQ